MATAVSAPGPPGQSIELIVTKDNDSSTEFFNEDIPKMPESFCILEELECVESWHNEVEDEETGSSRPSNGNVSDSENSLKLILSSDDEANDVITTESSTAPPITSSSPLFEVGRDFAHKDYGDVTSAESSCMPVATCNPIVGVTSEQNETNDIVHTESSPVINPVPNTSAAVRGKNCTHIEFYKANNMCSGRKSKRNVNSWKPNIHKPRHKVSEKDYISSTEKTVPAKDLKPYIHSCKYCCNDNIPEKIRQTIHNKYWQYSSWDLQASFLKSCLVPNPSKQTKKGNCKKQNYNHVIFLNGHSVCKEFFVKTLGISNITFNRVVKKHADSQSFVTTTQKNKQIRKRETKCRKSSSTNHATHSFTSVVGNDSACGVSKYSISASSSSVSVATVDASIAIESKKVFLNAPSNTKFNREKKKRVESQSCAVANQKDKHIPKRKTKEAIASSLTSTPDNSTAAVGRNSTFDAAKDQNLTESTSVPTVNSGTFAAVRTHAVHGKTINKVYTESSHVPGPTAVVKGEGYMRSRSDSAHNICYSKKHERNVHELKMNLRKQLCNSVNEYDSCTQKTVPTKVLEPYNHSCKYHCNNNIPDGIRQIVHDNFWQYSSSNKQNYFISSCVVFNSLRQPKKRTCKNRNYSHTLLLYGYRVCKDFFVKTLGISNARFNRVVKERAETQYFPSKSQRDKHSTRRKTKDTKVLSITDTDLVSSSAVVNTDSECGVFNNVILTESSSVSADTHGSSVAAEGKEYLMKPLGISNSMFKRVLRKHTDPQSFSSNKQSGRQTVRRKTKTLKPPSLPAVTRGASAFIGRVSTYRKSNDVVPTESSPVPVVISGTPTAVEGKGLFAKTLGIASTRFNRQQGKRAIAQSLSLTNQRGKRTPGKKSKESTPLSLSAVISGSLTVADRDSDRASNKVSHTEEAFMLDASPGTSKAVEIEDNTDCEGDGSRKRNGTKRMRNEEKWIKNVRKRLRNLGKEYHGITGKVVPERVLQPYNHTCRNHCNDNIPENIRQQIHKRYWEYGSWEMQTRFLCSSVVTELPKRPNKDSRKKRKYSHTILLSGHRVCKEFFLKTLSISNTRYSRAIRKHADTQAFAPKQKKMHSPGEKTTKVKSSPITRLSSGSRVAIVDRDSTCGESKLRISTESLSMIGGTNDTSMAIQSKDFFAKPLGISSIKFKRKKLHTDLQSCSRTKQQTKHRPGRKCKDEVVLNIRDVTNSVNKSPKIRNIEPCDTRRRRGRPTVDRHAARS